MGAGLGGVQGRQRGGYVVQVIRTDLIVSSSCPLVIIFSSRRLSFVLVLSLCLVALASLPCWTLLLVSSLSARCAVFRLTFHRRLVWVLAFREHCVVVPSARYLIVPSPSH